jgi:hypothetical protein
MCLTDIYWFLSIHQAKGKESYQVNVFSFRKERATCPPWVRDNTDKKNQKTCSLENVHVFAVNSFFKTNGSSLVVKHLCQTP